MNSVKNQFRCPMIEMEVVTSYVTRRICTYELDTSRSEWTIEV